MEQFAFDKLSEDDQLLMLKYMPIEERVRFERINKNWASLLEGLWLRQKQLSFDYVFGQHFDQRVHCHPFALNDCIEYDLDDMPVDAKLKVISRCKNLKALKDDSGVFSAKNLATRLAKVLNENCKELEHLDISCSNRMFFELLTPSDKFNCLLNNYCGNLKDLYDKKSAGELLAMKSIYFNRVNEEFGCKDWYIINKLAVEHIVTCEWKARYNELTNLKSLVVKDSVWTDAVIGNFNRLEYVSLPTVTSSDLSRMFKNNLKLISLKLNWLADEVMQMVVESGSNMKELHLTLDFRMVENYKLWQDLAKLTKLRLLTISVVAYGNVVHGTKLNVNGLVSVLKTCTKLKYFQFIGNTTELIITEDEKEQIQNAVAEKSFRQLFVVTYGSDYHSKFHHSITVK